MSINKLAVFDVDGTLIDSRSSIFRAAVEAANEIGVSPPVYDDVRAIVGLSLFEALARMRPDLDQATVAAYTEAYKNAFVRFHADPDFFDALYPGAADLLAELKAEGWTLGMATGQSRRGVDRNLDLHGWHGLFDCTFCADDGPSKPHPHMLNRNMQATGFTPEHTVMIGDSAHDIAMARQAGVYAIGVTWGFHTPEELFTAGADEIVTDFNELREVLHNVRRTHVANFEGITSVK
jgi:phosphoglycolate phosphatase